MAQSEFDEHAWRRGRVPKRTAWASWPTLLVVLCDALLFWATFELGRHESLLVRAFAVPTLLLALLHCYLVLHECAHGAVFAARSYNALLGHLLGFVTLCPFLSRRRSHALHHAWTGHPERDPTNARAVRRLSQMSERELALLDLLWRAWLPFLALNERLGLWLAPFGRDLRGRGAAAERRATYGYLTGYAVVLASLLRFECLTVAISLYACAWVLLLVVEETINLPHHLHVPLTRSRLPLWQQGRLTHSCAGVAIWSRFVLLHFNLHEAHHVWPMRPWYELPAAHRALAQTSVPSFVSHELAWSLRQRRRPFADAFGPYLRPREFGQVQCSAK